MQGSGPLLPEETRTLLLVRLAGLVGESLLPESSLEWIPAGVALPPGVGEGGQVAVVLVGLVEVVGSDGNGLSAGWHGAGEAVGVLSALGCQPGRHRWRAWRDSFVALLPREAAPAVLGALGPERCDPRPAGA